MTDVLDAPATTPLGEPIKRTEDPRFITGKGEKSAYSEEGIASIIVHTTQYGIRNTSMKHTFTLAGKTHELDLIATPDGYRVAYQGSEHTLTGIETSSEWIRFHLNGAAHTLAVASDRGTHWVAFDGRMYQLKRQTRSRHAHHAGEDNPEGILHAPMPGQIRAVHVNPGDRVTKGQTLLLLEAMKMENELQAPKDGTVKSISSEPGKAVDGGALLLVIE